MLIQSLEERRAAAKQLLRIKQDEMSLDELDFAAALLLHQVIRRPEGQGPTEILVDEHWRLFTPTRNWEDYGTLVSRAELVSSTHPLYEDEADSDKITGYRFEAHAFYSGTEASGLDLRETVARSCAKLLEHEVNYGSSWGNT